ncbi:unnamed protein product, partial [Prorocentrum cordatum]
AMATAMMNQIDFHLSLVQRAMLAMSLSYGANFTSAVLLPVTREFAGNRDPPPGANDIFNALYRLEKKFLDLQDLAQNVNGMFDETRELVNRFHMLRREEGAPEYR